MKYAIKNSNGTFFEQMTGIGPAFGVDLEHAQKFDTVEDAVAMQGTHMLGFSTTEIEPVPEED